MKPTLNILTYVPKEGNSQAKPLKSLIDLWTDKEMEEGFVSMKMIVWFLSLAITTALDTVTATAISYPMNISFFPYSEGTSFMVG